MNDKHTNVLASLNGVPYLMAEYCDRDIIRNLDRSMIYTAVDVDTTEAMRAIVDICIDDIGRREDGRPNVIGNRTKQTDVINAIRNVFRHAKRSLPVIRAGLVVRVNYRIENGRTGQVLRSVYEDIRIPQRSYFLDVNPEDINNNAIVTNFSTTQVSTMNQFTHGTDPMVLRVTSVQMCYEVMKPNAMEPRIRVDRPYQRMEDLKAPYAYEETYGLYEYHKSRQHQQYLGQPMYEDCNPLIQPMDWFGYNRLYHFDNNCKDIIVHMDEIYNKYAKVTLIECGRLMINRAFMINPGERIIFKLCIWKNDIALFNDTTPIACALDYKPEPEFVPIHDYVVEPPEMHPVNPPMPPYSKDVIDTIQNAEINHIEDKVDRLYRMLYDILHHRPHPHPQPPCPPCPPCPPPGPGPHPHPGKKDKIKFILKALKEMQGEIKELQEEQCECPEMIPMTDEEIQEILDSIDDEGIDTLANELNYPGDGSATPTTTSSDEFDEMLNRILDSADDET